MRPTTRPAKPMSLQEVFNHVWQHFVIEEEPFCGTFRIDGTLASCNYSSTGCAIGCSLTKEDAEHLDKSFSNISIQGLYARWIAYPVYFSNDIHIDRLQQLQNIHDYNCKSPRFSHDMEKDLRLFAAQYMLSIPSE